MSTLLITYGPTHSGKTTFANRLKQKLGPDAKLIHVDNDEIDEFIKAKFNNLRTDPEVLARRSPSDPDLRLRIPQLIANYALGENYSVIATAAHPKQVIRQTYYDIAKANKAKVVLLIFRIADDEAFRRINANQRDDSILDTSPTGSLDFTSLYIQQKGNFEEPTDTEKEQCYKVLEVNEHNSEKVLESVVEALKTTNFE